MQNVVARTEKRNCEDQNRIKAQQTPARVEKTQIQQNEQKKHIHKQHKIKHSTQTKRPEKIQQNRRARPKKKPVAGH